MVEDKEDPNMFELAKLKPIRLTIKIFPLISIFLSSFLVFYLINFAFNIQHYFLTYIFGTFVIILITKSDLFLKFKQKDLEKNKSKFKFRETLTSLHEIIRRFRIDIGFRNGSLLSVRLVLFNILNDLFMITIIWTALFGASSLIFSTSINGDLLVRTLTILGIFAGIFQYYISESKRNYSNKLESSISNYVKEHIALDISIRDFLKECEKNKDLYNRMKKILFDEVEKKKNKKIYDKRIQFVNNINLSLNMNASLFFQYIELYEEFAKEGSKNKAELLNAYENFFKNKFTNFKEKVKKEDFSDLKKQLYSGIFFFNDVLMDIYKMDFTLSESNEPEEKSNFNEFYIKFAKDCTTHLVSFICVGESETINS